MTNREYAESKGICKLMDVKADMDAPLEQGFKDFIDTISKYTAALREKGNETITIYTRRAEDDA